MKYRSLTEEIKLLELGLPPQEDDGFIGGNLDPKEASLILIPVPLGSYCFIWRRNFKST